MWVARNAVTSPTTIAQIHENVIIFYLCADISVCLTEYKFRLRKRKPHKRRDHNNGRSACLEVIQVVIYKNQRRKEKNRRSRRSKNDY